MKWVFSASISCNVANDVGDWVARAAQRLGGFSTRSTYSSQVAVSRSGPSAQWKPLKFSSFEIKSNQWWPVRIQYDPFQASTRSPSFFLKVLNQGLPLM